MKHFEILFKISYPDEYFDFIYTNKYLSIFGYDININDLACFAVINIINENEAEILSFAVIKEYQGKKVGSKLLNKLIEELANMGIDRVKLIVSALNVVAINLYKKFGFLVEKEDPSYYKHLENKKAYYMGKEVKVKRFWIFDVFRRITKKILFNMSCNFFLYN